MEDFYLEDEVGKKNTHLRCVYCEELKGASKDFYRSSSRNTLTRGDAKGLGRIIACKSCVESLYTYLYKIYTNKEKAVYYLCAALDVYFSEDLLKNINPNSSSYIGEYFKLVSTSTELEDKSFSDTKGFTIEVASIKEDDLSNVLSGLDQTNRKEIIQVFHYDPFEEEPIEARKKLYRDLVTMADPAMVDDLVRQRAAIEIVRSFYRIDLWTKMLNDLTKDPQMMKSNSKAIKELVDTKNKEVKTITEFSKDHGFAERYANAKSKGAGTLSATIRDMEEFNFDDGKVNAYDVRTGASMQQAADISFTSIIKQLSLSEADYTEMLKEQRILMEELERDNLRLSEENRLIHKQIVKQELLEELRVDLINKGLGEQEIALAIADEIKVKR